MQDHYLLALLVFCKRSLLACVCGYSMGIGLADADTKSFAAPSRKATSETVTVLVRTIQATNPVAEERPSAPDAPTEIDDPLSDLQPKLIQLPFRSFKLVASKQEHLELTKRGTLALPNGQSVALRPIYADTHRMGMWLNWLDSDGSEILNTRVHFDSEDTIVTGTDSASNEGLLLAITASRSN